MDTDRPAEMAWLVRSSNFRHVFGRPANNNQCFEYANFTKNDKENNFCAVNPTFLAVVTETIGGGSFLVLPVNKPGRIDFNYPKVCGHTGPVLDIKWNPFNDYVIASASEDTVIRLWQIPEGGLKFDMTECMVKLTQHQRQVTQIEWHPTAENILLSAGKDFLCIIWNTEMASPVCTISCHTAVIFCIAWNQDGSMFATTSKDKKIRVIDPRSCSIISEGPGHQGNRVSKVTFLGHNNRLLTTGFSKSNVRQFNIWNYNDLTSPLAIETLDSSSGVLLPFYDYDTGVIFLAAKGDGNFFYYEIVNDSPYCHFLSEYKSSSPQSGLGHMCKRGVDPHKCEIVRFYKLHTRKNLLEPISMIVPRKSETFHEDIFPNTASGIPSMTADEWLSGKNCDPILMSLKDHQIVTPTDKRTVKSPKSKPAGVASRLSTASLSNTSKTVITKPTGTPPIISENRKVIDPPKNCTTPKRNVSQIRDRFIKDLNVPRSSSIVSQKKTVKRASSPRDTNTGSMASIKRNLSLDNNISNSVGTSASQKHIQSASTSQSLKLKLEQSHLFSSPLNAEPVSEGSTSPFRRSASLRGSRIKLGHSLYDKEKNIPEESKPFTRDNGELRLQSASSVSSDHFYTPPSSPQRRGPGSGDISPFMNGSPGRSLWAENPVYATNRAIVASQKHVTCTSDNVDTTQLDDILSDVLKDFESTASNFADPLLKKANSEYFPSMPSRKMTNLPSIQSSQRAKSDNNIERTVITDVQGTFVSEGNQAQSGADNIDLETDDLDKQALLDCISVDAPDDTLVKPSKLRASMRSRKARVPFSGSSRSSPEADNSSPCVESVPHYISPLASPRIYSASSSDVTSTKSYHNGQPGYFQANSSDLHISDNKSTSRPEVSSYTVGNGSSSGYVALNQDNKQRDNSEINNNKLRFVRRSRRDERSKTDLIVYPKESEYLQTTSNGRPHKYSLDESSANQGSDKFMFKMNSKAPNSSHVTQISAAPSNHAYQGSFKSQQQSKSEPEIGEVHSWCAWCDSHKRKIKFLNEQMLLKDKRIRQLELQMHRLQATDPSESNC